jgi:hypothetical protein
MATISEQLSTAGAGIAPSVSAVRFPIHYDEVTISLVDAATEKGSALAANDVIQALSIPANSVILSAGIEVVTVNAGSTVLTLDLGVTGGDVDNFVDGFDFVAAVASEFSAQPVAYAPVVIGATADTLDVLIASLSTTNTAGEFRVWAIYADVRDTRRPGIVALRS